MTGYVDLAPSPLAPPDHVLRCTDCGHDIGVHGHAGQLDPEKYVCVECLVAAALEPKVGRHLKAVA